MDTVLIKKLLKTFKCFKGVYSSDNIPQFTNFPIHIIVNTDPSYKKGEHWVAISINENGFGEYFDSFGLPPLKKDLFNFMTKNCKNSWIYNKLCLQNVTSTTCGHYCVLYTMFRCSGKSTRDFLMRFSTNQLKNDKMLENLLGKYNIY